MMPPSAHGGMNSGGMPSRQHMQQQQLQELEKVQRELEMQKQAILAGLSESPMSSMPMSSQGPMGSSGMGGGMGMCGSGGPGNGMGGNGNVAAGGGSGTGSHPAMNPRMAPPTPILPNQGQSEGGNHQWWICQICNVKAFASRDEAMQHELVCSQSNSRNASGMQQQHQSNPGQSQLQQQKSNGMGTGMGMPSQQQGMGHDAPQDHQSQQQQRHIQSGGFAGSMGPGLTASMDQQPDISNSDEQVQMSEGGEGPYRVLQKPVALAMEGDKDWLTPLHCFVREKCVEVFCATDKDVATPSKGKRKPIQVGQVGIRCPHCHKSTGGSANQRERGSVYYPTHSSSIYNATMNLLQRHLHSCSSVPQETMQQYQTLKADDARSGTSKKYWIESALSLGLVDTNNGIRVSARRPPMLPRLSRQQQAVEMRSARRRNSSDFFSPTSNADVSKSSGPHNHGGNPDGKSGLLSSGGPNGGDNNCGSGPHKGGVGHGNDGNKNADGTASDTKAIADTAPLVTPDDKPYATEFSYHLLSQMQPCVFTEADRLGKRKGLPAGFSGLACRHCFGGYGSGRFFPSSIKTLSDTSKTLNVLHNHMQRCRKCPQEVRDTLEKLRTTHDDERAKMKFGSQKAFFAKIWARLHDGSNPLKRKAPPAQNQQQQGNQQQEQGNQQQQQQQQHHPMQPPHVANQQLIGGLSGMSQMNFHGNMHMRGGMDGLDLLSRQTDMNNDAKRQRMGL